MQNKQTGLHNMNLLDTIAQAATYLDYTHLSYADTVAQYNIDLEWNNIHEAEEAFNECVNSYHELSFTNDLSDDQILSLNHNYQLESIEFDLLISRYNQLQSKEEG